MTQLVGSGLAADDKRVCRCRARSRARARRFGRARDDHATSARCRSSTAIRSTR